VFVGRTGRKEAYVAKKTAKEEAKDQFIAELQARVEWKGPGYVVDDEAVRHVNQTLQTARWIASQRLGASAGNDPETVLAVYDRITARAEMTMKIEGPTTVGGGKVLVEEKNEQQPTPPAL
jgi:hypothetical protein